MKKKIPKLPSIKDFKGPNKSNVYFDPHMKMYVPTIKKVKKRSKRKTA